MCSSACDGTHLSVYRSGPITEHIYLFTGICVRVGAAYVPFCSLFSFGAHPPRLRLPLRASWGWGGTRRLGNSIKFKHLHEKLPRSAVCTIACRNLLQRGFVISNRAQHDWSAEKERAHYGTHINVHASMCALMQTGCYCQGNAMYDG